MQVSLWQEVRVDGGMQPVVIFATVTDRHEDNLAPRPPQVDAVPDPSADWSQVGTCL